MFGRKIFKDLLTAFGFFCVREIPEGRKKETSFANEKGRKED